MRCRTARTAQLEGRCSVAVEEVRRAVATERTGEWPKFGCASARSSRISSGVTKPLYAKYRQSPMGPAHFRGPAKTNNTIFVI